MIPRNFLAVALALAVISVSPISVAHAGGRLSKVCDLLLSPISAVRSWLDREPSVAELAEQTDNELAEEHEFILYVSVKMRLDELGLPPEMEDEIWEQEVIRLYREAGGAVFWSARGRPRQVSHLVFVDTSFAKIDLRKYARLLEARLQALRELNDPSSQERQRLIQAALDDYPVAALDKSH